MNTVLRIQALTKRYRKLTAVGGLDLAVEAGEFVGLIGPNGAGKSTTMGCVAGVLNPDEGSVHVGEVDVLREPLQARKHISFVPQHLELYPYLTGLEYLQFVAATRGLDALGRDAQIEHLLGLMELEGAKHRLTKEYSGGMARKLGIVAALLGPPRLLLLDESFVGLDPESTFAIQGELRAFCQGGGAIVLTSHILDMLERLCSRVVMLMEGQVQWDEQMPRLLQRFGQKEGPKTLTQLYLQTAGKMPPGA